MDDLNKALNKEQGTFTIEFAMVAVFFSFLLMFSIDLVSKISVKGKLDRLSFSTANIVRERSQLFPDAGFDVEEEVFNKTDDIIKKSLTRTFSAFDETKYGSVLEIQTFDNDGNENAPISFEGGGVICQIASPLDGSLSFNTSRQRKATLYRMTLCYETENFYGNLIGEDYRTVTSQSITIAR